MLAWRAPTRATTAEPLLHHRRGIFRPGPVRAREELAVPAPSGRGRLLGPAAQAGRLRDQQRHRPGDPGRRAAWTACCAPSSTSAAIAPRPSSSKPCGSNKRAFVCPYHGWSYDLTGRLVGITDGAWFGEIDRSAARPAAARRRRALRPGLRRADGARGRRERSTSTWTNSYGPVKADLDLLGHGRLGRAVDHAAPAAHELEAGDRHLPRALSLPLPARRQRGAAVPRQHHHATSAATVIRASPSASPRCSRSRPSRARTGACSTTRSCSTTFSPIPCWPTPPIIAASSPAIR